MKAIDPEFIERYQKIYDFDPKSQVFALLAEAYRKIGKLPEALKIAKSGIQHHPQMASGHLVLGRIYLDSNEIQKALSPLKEATKLAPENILAHQFLAEAYLKLKRPKEALSTYKLILLINPNDPTATSAIKKLESLTADEYDDDLFALIHPTQPTARRTQATSTPSISSLDRILSLADAFAARNEIEKAIHILESSTHELGSHPEILRRLKMLANLSNDSPPEPNVPTQSQLNPLSRRDIVFNSKKELLTTLLKRVQTRRRGLES